MTYDRTSGYGAVLGIMAAFIVLQLIVLFCSREIYSALNDAEELCAGNLAMEVVTGGRILPLRDYMSDAHHGGVFLTSLIAIPVFRFVGASYACLKLAALLWPAATLLLLYALLASYVDGRAAFIGCLLYVFPSADAVFYHNWAMMTHEYIFTFSIAMLLVCRKIDNSPDEGRARTWMLALGFIAGFSFLVWPSNCIAGGMMSALCLMNRRPFPATKLRVKAGLLLGGVALGLGPALLWNRAIFDVLYTGSLSMASPLNFVEAVCGLCVRALPAAYRPWRSGGVAWQWPAYLTGVAAYAWAWFMLASRRRSYDGTLLFFITAYPLIYVFAYVNSALIKTSSYSPVLQSRYLCPVVSSFLLAEALMLHWAMTSGHLVLKAAGAGLLAALLAFGAFSYYTVLAPVEMGYGTREAGCFAQETGCRIVELYVDKEEGLKARMERVAGRSDTLVRNDITRGAAWLACLYKIIDSDSGAIDPGRFSGYIAMTERCVPEKLQPIFKEEIGAFVFRHLKYDLKSAIGDLTQGLGEGDAERSFVGLARVLPAWTRDPVKLRDAIRSIPCGNKAALLRAMGQYFATMPDREETVNAIAEGLEGKEFFLAGCREPYGTRLYWDPTICH